MGNTRKRKVSNKSKGKGNSFNRINRKNVAEFESMISIFIFLLLFAGISVFLIAIPRSTKSEIEKRNLAEFPQFTFESYFSGDFTAGIATFYDDTVPFRDDFKTAGYNFKSIFGIHTEDEVKIVGKPKKVDDPQGETSKPPVETSNKPKDENSKPAEESKTESSQTEESSQEQSSDTEEEEYTEENGIIVVKQNGHYRALELSCLAEAQEITMLRLLMRSISSLGTVSGFILLQHRLQVNTILRKTIPASY